MKLTLTSFEEYDEYRAVVGSIFNPIWLERSTPHRMRSIWRRADTLAKIEVASLGFFIESLQKEHRKWLADTVREIRNQAQSPHGLIFEIVALGSLAARGMHVRPMRRHHPGYDAEVSGGDGYTLRVSIKNHDISDHEKRFRFESARLANVVRRRVLASGKEWQAIIRSRSHLDSTAFQEISSILRRVSIRHGEIAPHLFQTRGASIYMRELLNSRFLPGTYTCNVSCIQPAQEQRRFEQNINLAINKFDKHSPRNLGQSNVIFMRVHGSADVKILRQYAQEAIAEPDCSVDAILLYQAVVGHQHMVPKIMYYVCDVVSPHYHGPSLKFPLQFPFGIVTAGQTGKRLVDVVGEDAVSVDDIGGEYSYQKGHLFCTGTSFMFPDSVPGIKQTLVIEQPGGKVYLHQPFAEDDDLFLL